MLYISTICVNTPEAGNEHRRIWSAGEKKSSRQRKRFTVFIYIYILYTNWMKHLCSHFSIMSMDKKWNLSSASITARISYRNNCPSHMSLCPIHTQADCRMIHLAFFFCFGFDLVFARSVIFACALPASSLSLSLSCGRLMSHTKHFASRQSINICHTFVFVRVCWPSMCGWRKSLYGYWTFKSIFRSHIKIWFKIAMKP